MAISTQDNMELNGERKVRAKLNEKITANYAKYHEYCRNMANGKDDPDDVLQECLAEICSMSASKLETVIPYLDYYIIQMIKYSMRSRTSKYFYKYHRNEVDASSMREARMLEKRRSTGMFNSRAWHSSIRCIRLTSTSLRGPLGRTITSPPGEMSK